MDHHESFPIPWTVNLPPVQEPGWSVNYLMQLNITTQIRQYHQDGEEVQQEFSLGTFSPDQSTQHQVLHDEGVLDGRPYLQQVTLIPLPFYAPAGLLLWRWSRLQAVKPQCLIGCRCMSTDQNVMSPSGGGAHTSGIHAVTRKCRQKACPS